MSNNKEEVGGVRGSVLWRRRKRHRRLRSKIARRGKTTADGGEFFNNLELPQKVEEATTSLYRKAVETHTLRGRDTKTVLAAAAYAACRQCGLPLTLDEIAEHSDTSKKEVGKSFRWLAHELRLKLRPASPLDYLDKFCQQLQTGGCVQSSAQHVLRRAEEKEITSGRGASGMAAAAIYVASIQCKEKITQRDIANVVGVTEVTIRNRYKELLKQLDIDIGV